MNANVAMTKRGFGEMAITGCMAGPIFNIFVGMGASNLKQIINILQAGGKGEIEFSIYKKKDGNLTHEIDSSAVLPLCLIIAQLFALTVIALNAVSNKYKVSYRFSLINTVLYAITIVGLVVFSLVYIKDEES